jgi:hypothetical protein
MELTGLSKALVRALIDPVQAEADPLTGVDRVIEEVALNSVLDSTPYDFLASIDQALQSETQLSLMGARKHSEHALRNFLLTLSERLTEMGFRRVDFSDI